jgi:hypothetical protein
MGRESICKCDWAGVTAKVKVLLETNEIVIRGELRGRVPLSAVKEVEALPDRLCFKVAGEPVQLFLGKDQAVKWAGAIKAGPPSLARKLGITGQTAVRMIGSTGDRALNAALAEAADVSAKNPDLIVACVGTAADLDAALKSANAQLQKAVPIWLVYAKGPGHPIDETVIRTTLRAKGLIDTKVAAVSAKLTALRFIRRKDS